MNLKLFLTNCLVILFVTKNIYAAGSSAVIKTKFEDKIDLFISADDVPAITAADSSITIKIKDAKISVEGLDSCEMFERLIENIADSDSDKGHNVIIKVVNGNRYLEKSDTRFDKIFTGLKMIKLSNDSEKISTSVILPYLMKENLKLVVIVNSKDKPFKFMLEEKKPSPVPVYLLPENQSGISEDIKFQIKIVAILSASIAIVAVLAYAYIKYTVPEDAEDL